MSILNRTLVLSKRLLKKIIKKIIHVELTRAISVNNNEIRKQDIVSLWRQENSKTNLRLNYNLSSESIVFDIGGYKGEWARDIFCKYNCNIYIFEPIPNFAELIKLRFSNNPKILVFPFGLYSETCQKEIAILNNSSSIYKNSNQKEEVHFEEAINFIKRNKIEHIDLMKINIEGGEYDLLNNLIHFDFVKNISNIQVQFHDFIPGAKYRMNAIHKQLKKSHKLTYQFEFVWENWELIKNNF